MIKDIIAQLMNRKSLTQKQAYAVMKEIMEGKATPSQIAGFLVALRNKGETVDEIAGSALAMRDASLPLSIHKKNVVDCCGTGGDGQGGINISTAVTFVVAGAGFTVAKHGNRSISSQCGSADVLEAMGIRIDAPTAVVEQSLDQLGLGFLFAPAFHPAMKFAMPTRRELGIRTVFNVLGPLTNPARASVQLIGVYAPEMTGMLANVLAKMGHKAGLVVHAEGWDEITLSGKTRVSEMLNGRVRHYYLTAKDFGLPKISNTFLKGGDAQKNAALILGLLEGKESPIRPVVVANAAALIWISERAFGKPAAKLKEAVKRADESLSSGAALKKFKELAEMSHNIQ